MPNDISALQQFAVLMQLVVRVLIQLEDIGCISDLHFSN